MVTTEELIESQRAQVESARTQLKEQKELVESKKKEAEEAKQKLQTAFSKLPAATQQRLRGQGLYAGMKGGQRLKIVESVKRDILGKQALVGEYEGELGKYEAEELAPFEQQIVVAEQQVAAQQAELSAFDTAKKYYNRGIPESSASGRVRYYLHEFYSEEDAAREAFAREIDTLQTQLGPSEKIIIDWKNMKIKSVESGAFGGTLSPEAYNKKIDEINKQIFGVTALKPVVDVSKDVPRTTKVKEISPLTGLREGPAELFPMVFVPELFPMVSAQDYFKTTGSPIKIEKTIPVSTYTGPIGKVPVSTYTGRPIGKIPPEFAAITKAIEQYNISGVMPPEIKIGELTARELVEKAREEGRLPTSTPEQFIWETIAKPIISPILDIPIIGKYQPMSVLAGGEVTFGQSLAGYQEMLETTGRAAAAGWTDILGGPEKLITTIPEEKYYVSPPAYGTVQYDPVTGKPMVDIRGLPVGREELVTIPERIVTTPAGYFVGGISFAPKMISYMAAPEATLVSDVAVAYEKEKELAKMTEKEFGKWWREYMKTEIIEDEERLTYAEAKEQVLPQIKSQLEAGIAVEGLVPLAILGGAGIFKGVQALTIPKIIDIKIPKIKKFGAEVQVPTQIGTVAEFEVFGYKPPVTATKITPIQEWLGLPGKPTQLTYPQIYRFRPLFGQPVVEQLPYLAEQYKIGGLRKLPPFMKLSKEEIVHLAMTRRPGLAQIKEITPTKPEFLLPEQIIKLPVAERQLYPQVMRTDIDKFFKAGMFEERYFWKPWKPSKEYYIGTAVRPIITTEGEAGLFAAEMRLRPAPFLKPLKEAPSPLQIKILRLPPKEIPLKKPIDLSEIGFIPPETGLPPPTISTITKAKQIQVPTSIIPYAKITIPKVVTKTYAKKLAAKAITKVEIPKEEMVSFWAGTGLYERTEEVSAITPKLVIKSEIIPRVDVAERTMQKIMPRMISAQKLILMPRITEIPRTTFFLAPREIQRVVPQVIPRVIPRVIQKVIPRVIQKVIPRVTPRIVSTPQPKPRPPKIPKIRIIPTLGVLGKEEKLKKKMKEFYTPEIRRYKKWIPLGKFVSPEKAVQIAKEKVRATLAAALRLKKGERIVPIEPKTEVFRPSKREQYVLIQKREARLSAPTEVKEIISTRRGKGIKWFKQK